MKRILLVISIICCLSANAQEMVKIQGNISPWLGKWIAFDGNKSYELTVRMDTLSYEKQNMTVITAVGSLTYKDNGVTTKKMSFEKVNTPIIALSLQSENILWCSFTDTKRKIIGDLYLELYSDTNNLSWRLNRSGIKNLAKRWTEKNFDIPLSLEFRKVR